MPPDLVSTFSALGDRTRLSIVTQLLNDGEKSAGEIVAHVGLSAPAVSRHLKVLCNAGVIARRVDRQRRIYSAQPQSLRAISDWTQTHQEFWTNSIDRLAAVLEGKTDNG